MYDERNTNNNCNNEAKWKINTSKMGVEFILVDYFIPYLWVGVT